MHTCYVRSIPILSYHSIGYAHKASRHKSIVVTPEKLARHLLWLKCFGYQALSISNLQPYLSGQKQGRVVGLTFDDGYLDNITYALPLLKKYGFTATCYMVASLLGKQNEWDIPKGISAKNLMTAQEIRAWHSSGMEVGAHSLTHVDLLSCRYDVANHEIVQSKIQLESIIDSQVNSFSYPYGKYDKQIVQRVAQAGYQTAVTTDRGRACAADSLLTLPRVDIPRTTYALLFYMKLCTKYEDQRREYNCIN